MNRQIYAQIPPLISRTSPPLKSLLRKTRKNAVCHRSFHSLNTRGLLGFCTKVGHAIQNKLIWWIKIKADDFELAENGNPDNLWWNEGEERKQLSTRSNSLLSHFKMIFSCTQTPRHGSNFHNMDFRSNSSHERISSNYLVKNRFLYIVKKKRDKKKFLKWICSIEKTGFGPIENAERIIKNSLLVSACFTKHSTLSGLTTHTG